MHVMIDLETLGTAPGSAIVQIAAVPFTLGENGTVLSSHLFERAVNLESCLAAGLTVAWWLRQEGTAREAMATALLAGVSLRSALADLATWPGTVPGLTVWNDVEGVWSHGAAFDQALLAAAYARAGMGSVPWPYRASRCTRTLFARLPGGEAPPSPIVAADIPAVRHTAAFDAASQAWQVTMAYRVLGS